MRLKEIIKENINENILRSFKDDCAAFLEINEGRFKNKNYLLRGTMSGYSKNIIKKKPRTRKTIHGNVHYTWMYDKFKPNDYPLRKELIPCQNGELASNWRRSREVYSIFPIEHRYKLHFNYNVSDFNTQNPYFKSEDLEKKLNSLIKNGEVPDYYELDAKNVLRHAERSHPRGYKDVKELQQKLWRTIQNIASESEEASDFIDFIKKSGELYFENSDLSKEIPKIEGLEIGVYAPSGFYYVKEEVVDEVLNQIYN